jgi:hypothetical protein
MSNALHVENANRAADCVWDMIEGAPDDDTSLPTEEQVNEWRENGLVTDFEGTLLLSGMTVNS